MNLFKTYIYPRFILDIVPLLLIISLVGAFLGGYAPWDFRFILSTLVLYLILVCMHVYNDVQDKNIDIQIPVQQLSVINHIKLVFGLYKHEGKRASQNPFSTGELTDLDSWRILLIILMIALLLSIFAGGFLGFFLVLIHFGLGVVYSENSLEIRKNKLVKSLIWSILFAGIPLFFYLSTRGSAMQVYPYIILIVVTIIFFIMKLRSPTQ